MTTALAEVANRLRVPYPVVLVLAGLALRLLPGLPPVVLAPNLVFFVFLPPLLYVSAQALSWLAFRAEARPIMLLVVATVAHYAVLGFGWGPAFVRAAIVSPTDAVSPAGRANSPGLALQSSQQPGLTTGHLRQGSAP